MPWGKRPRKPLIQRFMERVGPPTATGCREWKGAIGAAGYGHIWCVNKVQEAHTIAALLYYGAPEDGLEVCHTCGNRKCVNPQHLYYGTHKQNMADAVRRNRMQHPNKKITPEVLARIEALPTTISQSAIAQIFNVSQSTISLIRLGQWPRGRKTA